MHIGILHPFIEAGGAQRQVVELAKRFSLKSHEVTLFTGKVIERGGLYHKSLIGSSVKIVETGYKYSKYRYFEKLSTMLPMANWLLHHDILDVDVFNPHNWPSYLASYLFKRKRKPDVPFIWTCNEPTHFWLPNPLVPHTMAGLLSLLVDERAMHSMDRTLVLSRFMKEFMMKRYGVNSMVVGSGVDTDFFSPKHSTEIALKYGFNTNDLKILTVGKNFYETLKIFRRVVKRAKTRLYVLVNYPRDVPPLKKMVKKAGMNERVRFLPILEREHLPYVYSSADLFIFTNRYEPWGLVLLESMSCETPVLAYDSGGPRDFVIDGENGFLVTLESDFLDKILSFDRNNKKLGKNARKYVKSRFTWGNISDRYLTLFKSYLSSKLS